MELYLGGYYIVRNKNSRTPSNLYTASSCVMNILPDTWAWDQALSRQVRQQIKVDYNITNEKVNNIRQYTNKLIKQNEFLLPNIFANVETAIEFYSRFFSHIKNVKIISISTN